MDGAPSARLQHVADFEKPADIVSAIPLQKPASDSLPLAGGSPPTNHHDTPSVGANNILGATGNIELLGVTGDKVSSLPSGGLEVLGAASVVPAATDPTFGVQQSAKTIIGSPSADILYALDPNAMPSGTYERLIDVKAVLPTAGAVANTVAI